MPSNDAAVPFFELASWTFLNLIRECLAFGDGPVKTGNDISIPFSVESRLGHLDLAFDNIQSKFNSRYTATITMHFSKSSVVMLSPSALRFVELQGELSIVAPVTSLGPGDDSYSAVEVDFERSTSAMCFDELTVPTLIQEMLNGTVVEFVRSLGRQRFASRCSMLHS